MQRIVDMSSREIQDPKAIGGEMFVQQAAHDIADVLAVPLRAETISSQSREDRNPESIAEDGSCEPAATSLLTTTSVDATKLIRMQQFEGMAKHQASRIAFKAKGKFLFLDLAEVVAVKAEGNYVSLQHPPERLVEPLSATRTYSLAICAS